MHWGIKDGLMDFLSPSYREENIFGVPELN